jgi:hypothetical protein
VRVDVFRASAFALALLPLAAVSSHAQAPLPGTGFVPPYEIMRTVRSAGFDPLAPPLREGTTYVLRATDFRGVLMRVVVDAHSGAIRDVNRIVPGPGPAGQLGMASPAYGVPPGYGPPEYDAPDTAPGDETTAPPSSRAPTSHAGPRPSPSPPLPRPRPATLASRNAQTGAKPDAKGAAKHDAQTDMKSDVKSDAATTTAPAAPGKAAPPAPLND